MWHLARDLWGSTQVLRALVSGADVAIGGAPHTGYLLVVYICCACADARCNMRFPRQGSAPRWSYYQLESRVVDRSPSPGL